jgi:hypothetical protein
LSIGFGTLPGGTGGVAKVPAAVLREFIDAVAPKMNSLLCLALAGARVSTGLFKRSWIVDSDDDDDSHD